MSTPKLTPEQRDILSVAARSPVVDGWCKVSAPVLKYIRGRVPTRFLVIEEFPDGTARAHLTEDAQLILTQVLANGDNFGNVAQKGSINTAQAGKEPDPKSKDRAPTESEVAGSSPAVTAISKPLAHGWRTMNDAYTPTFGPALARLEGRSTGVAANVVFGGEWYAHIDGHYVRIHPTHWQPLPSTELE